jgi:predicted RNase H-like HicB family nuclease
MQHPVIVRIDTENQYVAQPLGIPEVRAVAATESEAIEKIGQALKEWLTSAKLIQVDVPDSNSDNPWLASFGRSADDPDFEEFVEELKLARSSEGTE